jgi:hypothetical protein
MRSRSGADRSRRSMAVKAVLRRLRDPIDQLPRDPHGEQENGSSRASVWSPPAG